ncbi:dual specificity protein phosphatase 14-like isoform X2 [Rhodnius prolixus]|uniref:dual specificity protein phosphatase 14-like isoform X2 n=1 Tax=Rhodnius prolixus TaxID=13249 RepID=UPI003D18D6C4
MWNSSTSIINKINPYLLLCGAPMLSNNSLSKLGITCIISASPELPVIPVPSSVKLHHTVNVMDSVESDLSSHFDIVADIIHKVEKEGGKTLVHCLAGVSRSVSLCIGYLIKHKKMTLSEAYHHVHSRRPCIRPNNGFFSQLINYEKQLTGTTTVEMVYNSGAKGLIPDVYEQDYYNTARYISRTHGTK